MKSKAIWDKSGESEWVHFGTGNDVNIKMVANIIDQFFIDTNLYLVTNRKESSEINKNEIQESILSLLGTKDFIIWDKKFERVIEFNHIGICRQGQAKLEK